MNKASTSFLAGTILDFSKRQNVIFWISQAAVILSTVIGVYLATSEGLKSAFEFHNITNLEKNYYTLSALNEETGTNNRYVEEFINSVLNKDHTGKVISLNYRPPPDLNWYVWITMSNVTETLELPVDILRDTNRYYLGLTELLEQYQGSSGNDKLRYAKSIEAFVLAAEGGLLKRISTQLQSYQVRLEKYNGLGAY